LNKKSYCFIIHVLKQRSKEQVMNEAMKADWIVAVYKADRRCRAGERFVARYPFSGMDRATVDRELRELTAQLYPPQAGWRFDVQQRYVTVRSLMSGQEVQIEADQRGGPCDPSRESYWSA
jgi:hypothetical protein